jgi:hypothetical protein
MSIKVGDVVEHFFHDSEPKGLGIVTEVKDSDTVKVSTQKGRYEWNQSQCTILIRNGEWVKTVDLVKGVQWDQALTSAVEQLSKVGVSDKTIAFLAFHFGRRVAPGMTVTEKFDTLVDELRAEGFEVRFTETYA